MAIPAVRSITTYTVIKNVVTLRINKTKTKDRYWLQSSL
jgi:hypothetical protein